MINTVTVQVSNEVISSIVCDKCKKRITPEDMVEYQELYFIRFIGGYGSVFGDSSEVSVDLCQCCLMDLIKPFYRVD
jgi:hypothetical protein